MTSPNLWKSATGLLLAASLAASAHAVTTYDANVTPGILFGSGVTNGSWTVTTTDDGLELGLRAKLRHGPSGAAANIFNSNGDGTYSFAAGVAPTQAAPTAVWSFEWAINTAVTGGSQVLGDLTYELGIDYNPSAATTFLTFDPIHDTDPNPARGGAWDHSMGTNATTSANDVQATNRPDYDENITLYNVAQNSWKPHWYIGGFGFDPTLDATYDIYLKAFGSQGEIASTSIQVIVGNGGAAVPDGGSVVAFLGLGLMALAGCRRWRQQRA